MGGLGRPGTDVVSRVVTRTGAAADCAEVADNGLSIVVVGPGTTGTCSTATGQGDGLANDAGKGEGRVGVTSLMLAKGARMAMRRALKRSNLAANLAPRRSKRRVVASTGCGCSAGLSANGTVASAVARGASAEGWCRSANPIAAVVVCLSVRHL